MLSTSSKMRNARPVRSIMVADSIAARQKKSAAVGLALSAGILVAGAPSVAAGEAIDVASVQRVESFKPSLLMSTQQPMIAMKVYSAPKLVGPVSAVASIDATRLVLADGQGGFFSGFAELLKEPTPKKTKPEKKAQEQKPPKQVDTSAEARRQELARVQEQAKQRPSPAARRQQLVQATNDKELRLQQEKADRDAAFGARKRDNFKASKEGEAVARDIRQAKLVAEKAARDDRLAAIKTQKAKDEKLAKIRAEKLLIKDEENRLVSREKYERRSRERREERRQRAEETARLQKEAAQKEELRRQKLGFKSTRSSV